MNHHHRFAAIAAAFGMVTAAACAFSCARLLRRPGSCCRPRRPNRTASCRGPTRPSSSSIPPRRGRSGSPLPTDTSPTFGTIQMIQTAKAYAAQPDVAAKLKEFKVVSTGEDVAAQIAAINNFINSGFDAIVVNVQIPAAFKPVIKRANDAGVVLVAFDNILDTEDAINVDVDQKGLGVYWAKWLDSAGPCRTAARFSKCAACPARRLTATATTASTRRWIRPARSGTSSRCSASGTTRLRRK